MGCSASSPEESSSANATTDRGILPSNSLRNIPRNGAWAMDGPPKTATDLLLMRSCFWESQTSGLAHVWEALRLMCEAVLEGNISLAETIAESAQIRTPRGDLSVCYDGFNSEYRIPRYCYCDPNNLVSPKEVAGMANSKSLHHVGTPTRLGNIILRIAATPKNFEQDIVLENMMSNTTIGSLKEELHRHLSAGRYDAPSNDPDSKVNTWKGTGLSPSDQRIFFRYVYHSLRIEQLRLLLHHLSLSRSILAKQSWHLSFLQRN